MLSNLQEKILNAEGPVIFVEASAAAGKTRVLVEKIRQSVEKKKRVVAFTFTNMAAGEIKSRLNLTNSDDLFIGTIHSYCASLLLKKGIKEALNAIKKENFDDLFEIISTHPEAIEPVDIVICDEAQDSNVLQFKFIFDIIHAPEYFICYDKKQCIYRWAGSCPELLDEYRWKYHGVAYEMNENYRNAKNILDFSKRIILPTGLEDNSISMRKLPVGLVKEEQFSEDIIIESINASKQYKKWAFLARTNAQVDQICYILKRNKIPYDTFKQGDLTKEELSKKMEEDSVKVLTIHSSKGLEWDYVGVYGAKFYNEEEKCISYVAATRARDGLLWLTAKRKVKPKSRTKEKVYDWSF